MKRAEIKVGEEYGAIAGTGRFDKEIEKALRVKVLEVGVERDGHSYASGGFRGHSFKANDAVRAKVVEPNRFYGWGVPPKRGDELTILTRNVWLPWAEVEEALDQAAVSKREREVEEEAQHKRVNAAVKWLRANGIKVQDQRGDRDWAYDEEPLAVAGNSRRSGETVKLTLAGIEKLMADGSPLPPPTS